MTLRNAKLTTEEMKAVASFIATGGHSNTPEDEARVQFIMGYFQAKTGMSPPGWTDELVARLGEPGNT